MSFHEQELKKIRTKTSASKETKRLIAEEIQKVKDELNALSHDESKENINKLREKYVEARKDAFKNGATSEADPDWAVPAVCESWLTSLMTDSEEDKALVEKQVELLQNPDRSEENSTFNYGFYITFIGTPLAYFLQGWILAIVVLIVGLTVSGWKNRYDGPFQAK